MCLCCATGALFSPLIANLNRSWRWQFLFPWPQAYYWCVNIRNFLRTHSWCMCMKIEIWYLWYSSILLFFKLSLKTGEKLKIGKFLLKIYDVIFSQNPSVSPSSLANPLPLNGWRHLRTAPPALWLSYRAWQRVFDARRVELRATLRTLFCKSGIRI